MAVLLASSHRRGQREQSLHPPQVPEDAIPSLSNGNLEQMEG